MFTIRSFIRQLTLAVCILAPVSSASEIPGKAYLLNLKGAVGPATADYLTRGIELANTSGADLIIIEMDTPGGLDKSMRQIIQSILSSKVPVAAFVSPRGARAASAGTYILYASHIAVMAPATNLGAATPVQIGAPGMPSSPKPADNKKEDDKNEHPPPAATAMEKKAINDASAYIQGLAELRKRNVEWAIKSVRGAESLSSKQALEANVIDLIAADIDDLLIKLDGYQVVLNDETTTLSTSDMNLINHIPDWRNQFLAVITDPNVAYILLLIGIYGLVLEFYSPGGGIAGVIGGISLLVALYALQILPISYTGLALLLLGLVLMVAEAMSPSFGILGIGGVIAFGFGSVMLIDSDLPAFQIAWPIILAITALSAAVMMLVVGMIWRSRQTTVVSGLTPLIGLTTQVSKVENDLPFVHLQGEQWQVDCDSPLEAGDPVRITDAKGLVLKATPASRASKEI